MATNPADLDLAAATVLMSRRELSASELVAACLARIRDHDGVHSDDGDPSSLNAWVRVYDEEALLVANVCDKRRSRGDPAPLLGLPVGLKDLYAVSGKPLTASSKVLQDIPDQDSDVWRALRAAGMVLLGHTHTHEFAFGGTTDQTGNPWALDRSPGGSSGGSAAALAACMTPAATGTDTAGSLRIPAAMCGISALKPTRGRISLRGVVPLAISLDHAGPMARTLADCELLLDALDPAPHVATTLAGARVALSPRLASAELDRDVAERFDVAVEACRRLGAALIDPPPPDVELDIGGDFFDVSAVEFIAYHRRFADRLSDYRPSTRKHYERAAVRGVSGERYVEIQMRRSETTARFDDWLADHRIDALIEPTVPVVAPARGDGYSGAGNRELISLTLFWNWLGLPVAALPCGVGRHSGLPCGVSLIGRRHADRQILGLGIALQRELGIDRAPVHPGSSPTNQDRSVTRAGAPRRPRG